VLFDSDTVYDPGSGLVVFRDDVSAEMWAYDVETNSWTEVNQDETPPSHPASLLAYDGSVDRFVLALVETATWLFDPRTGSWAVQETAPPPVPLFWGDLESGGEATFDEVTSRTVVFSDGVAVAYDAHADVWDVLQVEPGHSETQTGPLHRFQHAIVYDPVNERLVLYGGEARMPAGWRRLRDVWAFDPQTGTWTELVPRG
jgi:hypothetical protein